ncbi:MAG: type II toxin-antitoxin system death-on-curing family toxin [Vicinamibacterales bacterium]
MALGAAYAFGLVRNHPYRDGNKRIGFLAMVTFLGRNGYEFTAGDAEVVGEILALASSCLGRTGIRQKRAIRTCSLRIGSRAIAPPETE